VVISLDLADLVVAAGAKSVAIVGTAKNVGKTVTMNYLASKLSERGHVVGLVSSGRDGETTDSFTGEPKPSVIPPEGTWIATAEGVLGEAAGSLEIADVFEKAGLFGRLVLGRVRDAAPLELVGPQSAKELATVVGRLHEYGAQVVLVDGALDRVAAASPFVTGAVILSTGAAAGADPTLVARSAAFIVKVWSLRRPDDPEVLALASEAIDEGHVAFLDGLSGSASPGCSRGSPREAPGRKTSRYVLRRTAFGTVLGREEEVLSQAKGASFIVVPGAVSETLLSGAGGRPEGDRLAVITKDPTNLFIRSEPEVPVYVTREMRLLAITVNPVSGRGMSYDPAEMVAEVSREVLRSAGKSVPVFDVVSGEQEIREVRDVVVG
jgi:hypothetical protein